MNKLYSFLLFPFSTVRAFTRDRGITTLLLLSFLWIACYPSVTFGQQKSPYTLLWRISGKNLKSPSYLFGTMHVRDNRAFGFSDSVMLAMQNCPAFALEVHPDTLVKKMFITLADRDSARSLRKLLTKDEYEKLAARFEKKSGYPLGDIDPIQAEAMMKPQKEKQDDRKSFVDAYLFGVARSMGKSVHGLENSSQQFEEHYGLKNNEMKLRISEMLEEDNDEAELENTETLVDIYSSGNVDKIFKFLGDERLADPVLVARNKVMVKSMLSYMADGPLFTAVGVAHLPGETGLLKLLTDAGYQITPVVAGFTGVASKFNTDYTKLPWKTFKDEERGYSMEFPFTPMQTNAIMGLNTVIYADIANNMFFGAYAMLLGPVSKPADETALINKLINNLGAKSQYKFISKKVLVVNGFRATEVLVKKGEKEAMRYQILLNNNMLYCLYAGNQPSSINGEYANRFFNSFKALKAAPRINKDWITFKSDTAGFTVNLPGKPQYILKPVANPNSDDGSVFKLNMYLAIDSINFYTYLIRYNDYPRGTYLKDAKSAFDAIIKELKSKATLAKEIKTIYKNGYEGREFQMVLQEYNCVVQLFVRGNRIYMLLKQNLQSGAPVSADGDFLSSFNFTPYITSIPKTYTLNGGNFKTQVFADVKSTIDTSFVYSSFLKPNENVYSTNPASGGVYGTEHGTLSKYYRAKNADSLYTAMLPEIVKYTDSVVKNDTLTINGLRGREIITQKKGGKDRERYRLFIDNSDIVLMSAHLSAEELFDETSNKFFNSLRKLSSSAPIDLPTSKAELIVNDLQSKDTAANNYARGALTFYSFEKEELPYLYKALQNTYRDDSLTTGTRNKIIALFDNLKDDKTTGELLQLFKATTTTDVQRAAILSVVPAVDRKTGFDTYLNLLSNSPQLDVEGMYSIFSPMYDSLAYVAANYPTILELLKHEKYRKSLISINNSLLYDPENLKYATLVKNHFNDLTAYANQDLDRYLANKDSANNLYNLPIYSYLQLMSGVKGQRFTDNFTAKIIKHQNGSGYISDAVLTRLKNNLIVDQKLINKLLDSVETQYDVIKALNDAGQLVKVPLKYRTQQQSSKMFVYRYLSDQDEGTPDKIALLGTITFKGNLYYAYKYTVPDYDSDTEFLAVCGPYKPGLNKLDFKNNMAYSDWEAKKVNWRLQAKNLVAELIKTNQLGD